MGKSIFMETTGISVIKTCGEIESILAEHGVERVWKDYKNGEIEGFYFTLNKVTFKLPFRWRSIQQMAKNGYRKTADEVQARRVAARMVLRWIQAQIALLDVSMVTLEEIFLPYAYNYEKEATFYEVIANSGGLKALTERKDNESG